MAKREWYSWASISAALFIVAEAVLFPLIQLTPADVSAKASYLSIVLVALFAVFFTGSEKKAHLVRLGLGFTLVADYFLVLADDAELEGVVAFIFVQTVYCIYLILNEKRQRVRTLNLISRTFLSVALTGITFIVLGQDTDALSVVSVIYYANLVVNVLFAFLLGKEERIFAIGLTLFAMCDLCIGLEVLTSSYLDSSTLSFFYGANLNLPWVFYQPSQVLIALYLLLKNRNKGANRRPL